MEQGQQDIYSRVTDQIIEAIERGAEKFRMPWHVTDADCFSPANAASKKPYRGINVLSLWGAAERLGYSSGFWATYQQWKDLGAQVRKDEKSTLVVYWQIPERPRETTDDETAERPGRRFLVRSYPVFNADQVDGFTPAETPRLSESERIEKAERFIAALGADIKHGGNTAAFRPGHDDILMPRFESFRGGIAYYSTLAHELTHWTGAKHRLDRDLSGRFGSMSYAAEELVAELGAAFFCAGMKLTNEPRPEHAAYLASWLSLLKSDKRAIFTAASKAQAAVDWMNGRQENADAAA